MIRRPPRSTPLYSSAASDVYKRQPHRRSDRPMTEQLLDRDQVHASFVVMRRARPAQRMWAEPVGHRTPLQLLQIPQTVAYRPAMQRPATLVSKQNRRLGKPWPYIPHEPAQQHVQAVQPVSYT